MCAYDLLQLRQAAANASTIGCFYLMYWSKEIAVSMISDSEVFSEVRLIPEVGSECMVKVKGKNFTGVIVATGKLL